MTEEQFNSLSYWYPAIQQKVPTPRTRLVTAPESITKLPYLQDGVEMSSVEVAQLCLFYNQLRIQATTISMTGPWFLRSEQTSGKHNWSKTCCVTDLDEIDQHVYNIVEYSVLVSLLGLPYREWAIREFLACSVVGTLPKFGDMPLVPEMRYFSDGQTILHRQPYWPKNALAQGGAENIDTLHAQLVEGYPDCEQADRYAIEAAQRVMATQGPDAEPWSVDILLGKDNVYYVTDMALARTSFLYDPETQEQHDFKEWMDLCKR